MPARAYPLLAVLGYVASRVAFVAAGVRMDTSPLEYFWQLLDPQLLRNQGCFDAVRVRAIWEAFLRGERKWHTHLWNVLMFQAWYQHWHGNRGR